MGISHLYFWSILQFLFFVFLEGSNFSFLLLFHLRKDLSHLPLLLFNLSLLGLDLVCLCLYFCKLFLKQLLLLLPVSLTKLHPFVSFTEVIFVLIKK